ncbi:GNAT family N-acetyltransferase [Glaciecola sp. XM2]|jgi:putative acetyltransferase|uniref:GNAT family N-acetyltransferase n=1 Tax=Glaciecola sp. XM2 TaxID=1914931 RepID=UPI001BDE75BA|nr:GNAT family N-acetyltransferase [Glaciecola sp. XM2]MBT1451032.1 GNAT family N-acetyltransferase [Glaciecola sp. XM2]
MKIKVDDLSSGEVILLLEEHLSDMYATSPPECVHALDVKALKSPEITFFSTWINNKLAACIAIKRLSPSEAELKSMRTVHAFRGKGVASKQLEHVLNFAQEQGYERISLETGTQDYFKPARDLYQKFGFTECGPFSSYQLNPNSHFMTRCV